MLPDRSSWLPAVVLALLPLAVSTGESPKQPPPATEQEPATAATAAGDPDETSPTAVVARVRELLVGDRWREALDEAERAIERFPDDPRVVTALAEVRFRAGELETIESLLGPIVRSSEAPARAHVTYGRLRKAEGRFADAVEWMDRAVATAPDDPYVMYWAADATATRAEAVDRLQRFVELGGGDDPDRIEAAEGSLRLYRALGERVIWADEHRPERLEIPLRPVWNPGTPGATGYVIEAQVGERGKRVKLLLDTGSPGLYVVERIANKRGFRELSEQTTFGGGGDRRHATRRGLFDSFAVGELRFRSVLATASPDEVDPLGRYHGLIGLSAFNGYRVTLDLKRKRLIATRAPEAAPAGAPYWVVSGQWLVRVRDADDRRDGLFLFDTGATRTLIGASFVEGLEGVRVGEGSEIHGFGGALEGARTVDGIVLEFERHRVGPHDLRSVDLSLRSKMGGVEISGLLGLDLLDGPRITVDTVHRVIELSPPDDR